MKNKQHGFAHIQLVIIGLVVLGVIGLAAVRVNQSTNSNEQAKDLETDTSLAENIAINEDEQKEVTIPAEKEAATEEYVAPPKKTTTVKKTEPVEEVKKEKIYVGMQKIVAEQEGSVVKIVSRLDSPQSGTCNFKLYQSGYEKVYASNTISGVTDCVGQLDISNLQTYTGWELHVWFDGSDGKTYGYQKESSITLTDPN